MKPLPQNSYFMAALKGGYFYFILKTCPHDLHWEANMMTFKMLKSTGVATIPL